jgi:predicted nucleotidyltransferase
MIRQGKKLPADVAEKLPGLVDLVSADTDVVALFVFGSLASGELKPLSDIDLGVLLDKRLDKTDRFNKHLDLIGKFTGFFNTEEIDTIILNDAPMRFVVKVLSTGKLLFERDRPVLVDFYDKSVKNFLDFKYFIDDYNKTFLKGVGYHG